MHNNLQSSTDRAPASGVVVRVEDMSCGHCVGTIKGAIESAIPGARVTADLEAKLVTIEGASDSARINSIIADAGYTPSPAGH